MTQTRDASVDHRLESAPSPRWFLSPKWVRAFVGGVAVGDSKRIRLLRDGGPPVYYFPEDDVRRDLLVPSDHTTESPNKGTATFWHLKTGDRTVENAAFAYAAPPEDSSFLKGHISLVWGKMDAWFEEKEEVFVHARDPFKRIDAIKSSRNVRVVIGGETVAESDEPVLLFEPGHPIRYYLPKADVRMDLLEPSDTISRCAYKGEARYLSVRVGDSLANDVAWHYTYPTPETSTISRMVCFFNERVDEMYVDGELLPKPTTGWSRA